MARRVPALLAGAALICALATAPALAQKPSAEITAAVANPARPADDVKRDADRKPAEVVAFAGVKPGMTVIELFPGGGYYTRILSKVVGPNGKLYLVTPAALQARMGKGSDDLAKEVGNAAVVWQPGDTPSAPEKVDVVWTTDNYHDYRNPFAGSVDMAKFNKAVYDSLKPGGVFVIEDYETVPGAGATQTNTLHRIESSTVKAEVEAAGFKLESVSTVLQNKADDHSLKVQDPGIRGHADQYVLKFRKPK
jgi:predicted methyltransferase